MQERNSCEATTHGILHPGRVEEIHSDCPDEDVGQHDRVGPLELLGGGEGAEHKRHEDEEAEGGHANVHEAPRHQCNQAQLRQATQGDSRVCL
jgi:hypothetical protein